MNKIFYYVHELKVLLFFIWRILVNYIKLINSISYLLSITTMNILFLTIADIKEIETSSLYKDLLRKFVKEGHNMYIVSPAERRAHEKTRILESMGAKILKVKSLNITRTNVLEKGIATILIEHQYYRAINEYWGEVKFDLVLYSTPPITFNKVIRKIKKKYNAKSYLMLKDIFPQNAVDMGMMKKDSWIYNYFRKTEKKLYNISDFIGCMTPANINYVLNHNPEVQPSKFEICPNSIDIEANYFVTDKIVVRKEFGLPLTDIIFVYGGNLGKPQGIDFLLEVLKSNKNRDGVYFLIVGRGTEYSKIDNWIIESQTKNVKLLPFVPKEKYNYLISAGDIGLVFLHKNFTIPNFPTRIMGYLLHKMPILSATDIHTDAGKLIEENNCGFWVESGDLKAFNNKLEYIISHKEQIQVMGNNGYNYLISNYEVSVTYNAIMSHF